LSQKIYSPREEEEKYTIFKSNVALIAAKNAREVHATYALNRFADLTPTQFKQLYLMNVSQIFENDEAPIAMKSQSPKALPTAFDWRDKSVVTPVKDQGQCGSCWDFSATETIESVCAIAGYPLGALSEQQILDCDTTDGGCNGGWPYKAYQYVINAGGLESESDYPYTSRDGNCHFNKNLVKCKVSKWEYVTKSKDENAMQNFVYSNSPISVCVDAESWQFYTSGVITTSSNCGNALDHCVQVTGWSQMQGMTVWDVRNSWGSGWGVSGYLYVQKGADVCGIAQMVTAPCVVSTSGQTVC